MIPFVLLFLGLILILIEFYLPGAIMGVIGSLFILISIILFASQTSSPLIIFLFILGAIVSIGLLIQFALWRIVHAKPEYSIYSDQNQEGYKASGYDKNAIGKTGVVLADLKPGGYILIDGKQHQAISLSGYISKGAEIIVISGQEESLIVKSIKKESKL